jgi:hypothetical protein
VPVQDLVALPFLVPLYGGGALLIREVVRRSGLVATALLYLGGCATAWRIRAGARDPDDPVTPIDSSGQPAGGAAVGAP